MVDVTIHLACELRVPVVEHHILDFHGIEIDDSCMHFIMKFTKALSHLLHHRAVRIRSHGLAVNPVQSFSYFTTLVRFRFSPGKTAFAVLQGPGAITIIYVFIKSNKFIANLHTAHVKHVSPTPLGVIVSKMLSSLGNRDLCCL